MLQATEENAASNADNTKKIQSEEDVICALVCARINKQLNKAN